MAYYMIMDNRNSNPSPSPPTTHQGPLSHKVQGRGLGGEGRWLQVLHMSSSHVLKVIEHF